VQTLLHRYLVEPSVRIQPLQVSKNVRESSRPTSRMLKLRPRHLPRPQKHIQVLMRHCGQGRNPNILQLNANLVFNLFGLYHNRIEFLQNIHFQGVEVLFVLRKKRFEVVFDFADLL
jgi:hypothetical protein